ncbi:hypothetical protein EJ02DRAFT_455535 [Clathrospora elynae]|uniref:Uncharacterized protein n=1 Tax=Clathrospora elynae TaxID=706981 RepID=A0A6A5SMH0_9PLEO|nr:hypothetical protein EJ02DRAFT_455535 [Clathrospora elynae]
MPFRDREWENFQRDCDFFPAYSDYLYGPDTRPEAAEQPGLHPQIFPQVVAPVRYTNSMPSRSWFYHTSDGLANANGLANSFAQPGNVALPAELGDDGGMGNAGLPPGGGSSASEYGIDMRSQLESPLGALDPPQASRAISAAEMTRRMQLNASQRRPHLTPALLPNPLQQSVRVTRQQAPIQGSPPAKPSLLRSSSTTDVDEQLLAQMATRNMGMLSPAASPAPMPPPAPPARSKQAPLLRPNDLVNNPRYLFIDVGKRQQFNHMLNIRWNVFQNHDDSNLKRKAMMDIQSVSKMVYAAGEKFEEGKRRIEEAQAQQTQQGYAHSQSLLASSPAPAPHQFDQQPTYSQIPHQSPRHPVQQTQPLNEQLRANIKANLPELWRCLQLTSIHLPSPTTPDAIQTKLTALRWLESFKATLPHEGHAYCAGLVHSMNKVANEGGDPMSVLDGQMPATAMAEKDFFDVIQGMGRIEGRDMQPM